MDRDTPLEFQLGNATKVFFQDCGFDLHLMFIGGMLVMAAATAAEVRTRRFYSVWRSLQNRFGLPACKTAFLFEQRSLDSFAFKHKGDEHSFAGTVLIRGQTGEAVAAIHEFFNGELQARILCWKRSDV